MVDVFELREIFRNFVALFFFFERVALKYSHEEVVVLIVPQRYPPQDPFNLSGFVFIYERMNISEDLTVQQKAKSGCAFRFHLSITALYNVKSARGNGPLAEEVAPS